MRKRLFPHLAGSCLLVSVVLTSHFAAAALPGKATLISPSGAIGTLHTPTYTWNADPGSTWYYLWVNDSAGNKITQWYTADAVGCSNGVWICNATPDIVLAPGSAKWWVQTWNPDGDGPWSDSMAFTVSVPDPPGKATLISPSAASATNTPSYTWYANPNSTWYYLWVDDSTGNRVTRWYRDYEVGCLGAGICAVTPDIALAPGSAQWWIQTWNWGGNGPWSDAKAFTVPAPAPPGKATLISPSGTIGTNTPNFTWNTDPKSTWYYLWVNDSTGIRLQKWYTAVQAGCSEVTGTCVVWPGVYLWQGSAQWWIQTWSPNGTGPWSDGNVYTVPVPLPGSMVDLGALSGWGSGATGVSADGSVVVGWAIVGYEHAFRWTQAGGMVDLGTLGGPGSQVSGVSADGSVVVGYSTNSAGHERAFRWTQAGGMVDLGTLGGLQSRAYGVSIEGTVVVGYSTNNAGHERAFRWTQAGGMVDLGTLGGSTSRATAVSADENVVVGYSKNDAGQERAFRWTNKAMVDLGTLDGARTAANGLSADGSVVVGYSWNDTVLHHAFRWTQAGGMRDLGTLGGLHSYVTGLSMDGSVVVGYSTNNGGQVRAFRWTKVDSMRDLGTFGGSNSQAFGVSADGSVVVGFAENNDQKKRAFRWMDKVMVDLGTLGGSDSLVRAVSADGEVVAGLARNNDGTNHAFRWK